MNEKQLTIQNAIGDEVSITVYYEPAEPSDRDTNYNPNADIIMVHAELMTQTYNLEKKRFETEVVNIFQWLTLKQIDEILVEINT